MNTEELNYLMDRRNNVIAPPYIITKIERHHITIEWLDEFLDEFYSEESISYPITTFLITREVCDICEGAGHCVNPSIDASGLTADDMKDPDFADDYFSGVYDIPCPQCRGEKVICLPVFPEEVQTNVNQYYVNQHRYQRERAYNRYYGC